MSCDYILGLSINPKHDAMAEPWREQCTWRWWPGRKSRRFHQFTYQAGSWSKAEKVIARVEATENGSDARFVMPKARLTAVRFGFFWTRRKGLTVVGLDRFSVWTGHETGPTAMRHQNSLMHDRAKRIPGRRFDRSVEHHGAVRQAGLRL